MFYFQQLLYFDDKSIRVFFDRAIHVLRGQHREIFTRHVTSFIKYGIVVSDSHIIISIEK